MRDGTRLFTSFYVPKDTTQTYPILLRRTPYNSEPAGEDRFNFTVGLNADFIEAGYILAFQDVRGRYMSEGEFVDVRPHNPDKQGPEDIDESSDTWDTIEWLVNNVPRNNGRVGILGISYPGFYSTMSLPGSPPGAQGGVSTGPGHQLVHRRRLPPQRRLLPDGRVLVLRLVRTTEARAHPPRKRAVPVAEPGRVRLLPPAWPDPERRGAILRGQHQVLVGSDGPPGLRRLVEGPRSAAAPDGCDARSHGRRWSVRRRGPRTVRSRCTGR